MVIDIREVIEAAKSKMFFVLLLENNQIGNTGNR
jgi:hypothetical protein